MSMAIENVALSDWLFEVGSLSPGHLPAEGSKSKVQGCEAKS